MQEDPSAQLRNVKDFLVLYNVITEHCFVKCVTDLRKVHLIDSEEVCVNSCASMFLQTNRRLMTQFMKHTPDMIKERTKQIEAYNKSAEVELQNNPN